MNEEQYLNERLEDPFIPGKTLSQKILEQHLVKGKLCNY